MFVPVSDQKRLIHILADDLQPRIDWAYALEQTIALLGGGYLTAGNGDPNGLVTKPEGYLFLDLTTPAVWQNQNGGTVWTKLGAGGGSAFPNFTGAGSPEGVVTANKGQWYEDAATGALWNFQGTNGTSTGWGCGIVGGVGSTSFPGVAGATALLIGRVSGSTNGAQVFGKTGGGHAILNNIVTDVDENDRQAQFDGYVESDDGVISASPFASGVVHADGTANPGEPGFGNSTNYSKLVLENTPEAGGLRGILNPAAMRLQLRRCVAQMLPLLWLTDESDNQICALNADGSIIATGAIGTSASEPADGAIAAGQMFIYFDPTNGAANFKTKGRTLDGTIVKSTGPMT